MFFAFPVVIFPVSDQKQGKSTIRRGGIAARERTVSWTKWGAGAGAGLTALALPALALAATSSAPGINSGDTAWILTATALVLFMTLPGLALFYGGLVRSRNVLSVMAQCVGIACVASVVWMICGYSLSFSGKDALIGDLARLGMGGMQRSSVTGTIPEAAFFAFQMAFAVITPALIIGAFVERVKFGAVLAFSALWLVLVYAPVCPGVWGGGWLMGAHVMDYAGGVVVHATAGVSALLLAWKIGPRDGYPRDLSPPHNPGLTMIGAGMLWVGWYGFNAGSALAANGDAAAALVATHMSAATAGLVWAGIEWIKFKRVSMVGLVTGVVAGLATVTPASGFVGPLGGMILGAAGSLVCYHAVELVRHVIRIDDSLDVFAVHGVGGVLGTLLAPFLASQALGGAGLAPGMTVMSQFGVQVLGVLTVCALSGAVTLVLFELINRTLGMRVADEVLDEGLDMAAHGEKAYRTNN